MESELQYYTRRAADELQAAASARSPEARLRHRTLAEHYTAIVLEHENAPSAVADAPAAIDTPTLP